MTYNVGDKGIVITTQNMGSEFIKNNIPDASDNVLVYPLTTGALPIAIGVTDSSYRDWETDRKSTRLNSSHSAKSRMPSSA